MSLKGVQETLCTSPQLSVDFLQGNGAFKGAPGYPPRTSGVLQTHSHALGSGLTAQGSPALS